MGDRVIELLCTKHPNARLPSAASLNTYTGRPSEPVPVGITYDTVMEVAVRLSRGNSPWGADSVRLQHWLLRFGAASGEL